MLAKNLLKLLSGASSASEVMIPSTVTWNVLDSDSGIVLTNGNLTATRSGGSQGRIRAPVGVSSGKYYFECYCNFVSNTVSIWGIGVANLSESTSTFMGSDSNSWAYYNDGAKFHNSGSGTAFGSSFTTGDIVGIALDMTSGKIWFSINGTWQASGDPANGTNEAFNGLSGTLYPGFTPYFTLNSATARFAFTDWTYSAPSGFSQIT